MQQGIFIKEVPSPAGAKDGEYVLLLEQKDS
jgi:hypothetical protein